MSFQLKVALFCFEKQQLCMENTLMPGILSIQHDTLAGMGIQARLLYRTCFLVRSQQLESFWRDTKYVVQSTENVRDMF